MQMDLLNLVKIECIATAVSASSKLECLHNIARLAKKSSPLSNISETEIFEALEQREDLGSTGFENGIAIPHCRLENINEFVVGIMTLPDGIEFDALDGKKTNIVLFIIAPQSQTNAHVRLLSTISNILRIPEARSEILAAKSPEALQESFLRFNRDETDAKKVGEKSLFHITITNDDLFQNILQVVTAMEPASLSIIEAKQASEYLSKMPMFAGFWNEIESVSNKIIIAQIDKAMTNETIRRLEDVTGKLDECTEVSISVQEIFYSAGRLQS